jgi:hypothetical protein
VTIQRAVGETCVNDSRIDNNKTRIAPHQGNVVTGPALVAQ